MFIFVFIFMFIFYVLFSFMFIFVFIFVYIFMFIFVFVFVCFYLRLFDFVEICSANYQEFINSVNELLEVRQDTRQLREAIIVINKETQSTAAFLLERVSPPLSFHPSLPSPLPLTFTPSGASPRSKKERKTKSRGRHHGYARPAARHLCLYAN
jgi:hypothetical protein